MPTIKQLPAATSVNATDVLPISQGGTTKALTVAGLLSSTQAALSLASGKLLGRVSGSAGGPEPVSVGAGLSVDGGTLSATAADHVTLPLAAALGAGDEVVVNTGGHAARMPAVALRDLFSAGSGVSISGGTISVTGSSYVLPVASTQTLGGVRLDGSSIVADGSGVISATLRLPAVLGASGTPLAVTAAGAAFTLQNGNLGVADVPGTAGGYDGVRSVVVVQPGSAIGQAAALGGHVLNRAASSGGTDNAGIAVWGEAVSDADGARALGLSLSLNDGRSGGTGAGRVLSNSVSVAVTHAQTVVSGFSVAANFTVQPGGADGYVVATQGNAGSAAAPRWANGVSVRAGSAQVAMRVGVVAGTGACGSMPVVFETVDAGGVSRTARLEAGADGTVAVTAPGLVLQTASGQSLATFGSGGQALPAAAATGASSSLPLVLSGRDAGGNAASVTLKADAGGNAAVTAADVLFQVSGAVRVNGLALLTSAAVPAGGGLLATSGAAGAAQVATVAQFEALMTAWLQSKAAAPSAMPGWWNNAGNPTFS